MFFIIKKKKTYSSNEVIIPSFIEYLFIKTAIKNRNIFILDVGNWFFGLRKHIYVFYFLFLG